MRHIDTQLEIDRIVEFIKEYFNNNGFDKAIVGLSGGIDSSLVATLSVKALGRENVIGVMLPWKNSHIDSLGDAKIIADYLGIRYEVVSITPMVEAYFTESEKADQLRLANMIARIRMCVLYDLSAKYKALVMGTSNLTELLIGYFTQYGDGACALEPIGHLFKTEVWAISRVLGIPEKVINKTPTADLWQGQTDESEIGIKYQTIDEILYLFYLNKLSKEDIVALGFNSIDVERVINLIYKTEFKRRLPLTINKYSN